MEIIKASTTETLSVICKAQMLSRIKNIYYFCKTLYYVSVRGVTDESNRQTIHKVLKFYILAIYKTGSCETGNRIVVSIARGTWSAIDKLKKKLFRRQE